MFTFNYKDLAKDNDDECKLYKTTINETQTNNDDETTLYIPQCISTGTSQHAVSFDPL